MSHKLNSKHMFLLAALLGATLLLGGFAYLTRAAAENTQPLIPPIWMDAAPIPEAIAASKAQCADDPDSFYLVGGATNAPIYNTDSVYRYDAPTNTWTQLASMPTALRMQATTCYEGKIYSAGGWDIMNISWSFYIYDIGTDTWSSGPILPRPVWGGALGAWDGKVYLVGGAPSGSPYTPVPTVNIYDIATGMWELAQGPPMPVPSSFVGYVQAGPYLYIAGGFSGDLFTNVTATQRFDMRTQTWEQGPAFTSGRAIMGLAITGQYLYALGGDPDGDGTSSNQTDLVERLDHTLWPGGIWEEFLPTLPFAVEGNTSFCTEAMAGGEVWSTGGGNLVGTTLILTNTNLYHAAEPCFSLYGLTLTPETAALEGLPGETVTYTLQLTNTGLLTDTYDLSVTAVWTTTAPATAGPLGPGESLSFQVVVTVPVTATFFDADTALLTATSQGDPGEYATASLTTSVPTYWATAANPPLIVAGTARAQCDDDPDGFYILGGFYSLPDGDTDKVFHYDATTGFWAELAPLPEPHRISSAVCYDGKIYDAGGLQYGTGILNGFYIYDIAANSWSQGMDVPRNVWAAAIGAWDGKIYLVGGTATGNPPFAPVPTVNVYDIATGMWSTDLPMPVASGFAGYVQAGPYLYVVGGLSGDLYNNVTATQRFDMSTQTWTMGPEFTSGHALFGLSITGQYLYAIAGDPNEDGTVSYTDLVEALDHTQWPGGAWEERFSPFARAAASNVSFCTEAVVGGEVWSVGGGPPTVYYHPAEPCFTVSYGLALTPDADALTALPGGTVTYTLQVTNTGNVGDTYTVTVGANWTTDAPLAIGPLDPGAAETFDVAVTIPGDASPGDMDIANVNLTSHGDPLQTASAALTTTVLPTFGVSLTPSSSGMGYVGEPVAYTLQLNNLGTITDTFSLAATGNVWDVTLPFTETTLAPGEVLSLTVSISIPANAVDGATDSVTLSATSTSDPAQTASATLTTTAFWHRNFLPVIVR